EKIRREICVAVDNRLDGKLEPVKRSIEAVAQRTSKPLGSIADAAAIRPSQTPAIELDRDSGLTEFLRSNPGRRSFLKTEVPFRVGREISHKAITPILSSGLPGTHATILGPQLPATRLMSLIPSVPVAGGSVIWTRETGFVP